MDRELNNPQRHLMVGKGSYPEMTQDFRLVNSYISIYIYKSQLGLLPHAAILHQGDFFLGVQSEVIVGLSVSTC